MLSESGTVPGVSFNNSTGVLSGVPTTPGTYALTFTANNAVGSATQNFILAVNAAPTVTSNTTATFVAGNRW